MVRTTMERGLPALLLARADDDAPPANSTSDAFLDLISNPFQSEV